MRIISAGILLILGVTLLQAQELPTDWIDPDTGHRVIRLSKENGSTSLYFHQNGYTPDGQKLIIMTPTGLSTVNLKTRAVEKVVEGRVNLIMLGKKQVGLTTLRIASSSVSILQRKRRRRSRRYLRTDRLPA